MRKIATAILLLAAWPAWAATEYLRPTSGVNQGAASGTQCDQGYTSKAPTGTASTVYSGKSGIGPTGSGSTITLSTTTSTDYQGDTLYSSFQTTSKSYSSLTLSINGYDESSYGDSLAYYSTDAGSTWVQFTWGSTQATQTVTVTGATISNLKVLFCYNTSGSGSHGEAFIQDIWTAGTYTASTGQDGGTFDDGRLIFPWRREKNDDLCWV